MLALGRNQKKPLCLLPQNHLLHLRPDREKQGEGKNDPRGSKILAAKEMSGNGPGLFIVFLLFS